MSWGMYYVGREESNIQRRSAASSKWLLTSNGERVYILMPCFVLVTSNKQHKM